MEKKIFGGGKENIMKKWQYIKEYNDAKYVCV